MNDEDLARPSVSWSSLAYARQVPATPLRFA